MSADIEADYYEILQVNQTATSDELRKAYEEIIDAAKRRLYDNRYQKVKAHQKAEQAQREWNEKKKKQEEQAQREAAAEEEAINEKYRLQSSALWQVEREIGLLERQQERWKKEEDDKIAKRKAENGWFAYIFGSKKNASVPTDDEKRLAEQQRLQLEATKRIKAEELRRKRQLHLQAKHHLDQIDDIRKRLIERRLEQEAQKAREEARRQNLERLERERIVREAERQRRAKEEEKAQAERAERQRKHAEALEALLKRQREEKAKREAEAAKRLAEIMAEQRRSQREQRRQKAKQKPTRAACSHAGWWPKIDGPGRCEECKTFYHQWILQCPRCQMQACARCRPLLQGQRSNHYESRQSGAFDSYREMFDDYDFY
ncbi:MAG: hypothetical protein M1814_004946 [Vezdaea aestivalis]|nr:MAG: hypothetical protein M1814_004946 [Vezdaea aestivalis]